MYTAAFIKARGQACSILRASPASSFVSMTLATKGYSDNRELFREGLMLADSALQGGEAFSVGTETFLTRSVYPDPQSGQIAFLATKVNTVLSHQRFTETVDANGNVVQVWKAITSSVYSTATATTAALLEKDPGLLPNTRWIHIIPATVPLEKLDRLVFDDGTKCQVEDIDRLRLPGLLRVQCADDLRSGTDYIEPPEEEESPIEPPEES